MKLTLALAAAALGATAIAEPALAQDNEQFMPALVYRTGPYAPNGIPFADGVADYLDAAQRARRRHQRRQDHVGGMRDRLRHRQGRRVLRAPQGQGPDRRGYFSPLSTGITFALTEKAPGDKIPLLTMGYGRSESRRRRGVPVELHRRRHATGPRPTSPSSTSPTSSAASTSSRARRSASSITTARTARSRSRRSKRAPSSTASPSRRSRSRIPASSRSRSGWRSARTGPTTCCCGAGA